MSFGISEDNKSLVASHWSLAKYIVLRFPTPMNQNRIHWAPRLSTAAPHNAAERRRPEIVAKIAGGAAPHAASVQKIGRLAISAVPT
jgi:hypothetical protein